MNPRRPELGQSMTEFALVFPIFIMLVFGIIDLGRFVYTANALNNGAREGTRFATVAIRPTECAAMTRAACAEEIARTRSWGVARDVIAVASTCSRVAADGSTFTVAVANCRTNDMLRVTTTTEFTLLTPVIAQFLGDFTITGDAQMAVNQ